MAHKKNETILTDDAESKHWFSVMLLVWFLRLIEMRWTPHRSDGVSALHSGSNQVAFYAVVVVLSAVRGGDLELGHF